MLGKVSPYWIILLGIILFWVALDMLGVQRSISGGMINRFKLKGRKGAFLLGLAYGIVSGFCTFVEVKESDRLLLCSDGLTKHVADQELEAALAKGNALQTAQCLLEEALEAGVKDNIAIVVVDVGF